MQIVIVGCGIAAITAAKAIRENASEAEISIYTDEKYLYYPRPRLYDVITGETKLQGLLPYSEQWYQEQKIRVRLNSKVTSLKTDRKELVLGDNSRINYDKLLLANGAHPYVPPIKGVDKAGVFTLRTLEDALAIREFPKKKGKAIVIGGGLLGLEFAACLRKIGQQVEVLEVLPRLLPMQLDQEASSILRDDFEKRGIDVMLEVKATEILGKDTVSGVSLDDGKELSSDLILVASGIRPNINLASEAGIKVNKGVIVDQFLQTSVNDVYAAGDVSEFNGRVYGIIPPAIEQAKMASTNILGKEKRVYKGTVHSTSLKIAGISLTSIGLVNPEEPQYEEIKKVDQQEGVYKKMFLEQGKIVGAIILGERKGVSSIMKLMEQEVDVTRYKDQLLEDDFDYRKILF